MATVSWYAIVNALKDVVKQVHALDDALVELNKVADLSSEQTEDLKQRAFDIAEQVGQTGEEAINAITEVKRAGFTLAESEEVAEYALMMTNVAEGIDDAGDAANILISILKGTNAEVSYASTLLDEMNEISNNSAISFDALAEMTQEIAGTMNTLGATTEETMALLTGAYEVLQDERVAKGISVIGLRIQGLTEDLEEEAGLQSTVNDALMTFAGISVFDESGQLRNYYDILEDLSEVWDDLSKNAQAYLTTTLAGKNRADVLTALMSNWEGVSEAMQQAADSAGSAADEQESYLNSISGKLTAMKSAWQELSDTTLDSGVVKFFVDLATLLTKASNATGGLVNSIGLVYGAILLIKGLDLPAFLHNMIVMLNGTASAETVVTMQTSALKASIGGLTLAITALIAIISLIKTSIDELHAKRQETIADGEAIADNAIKLKQLSAELEINKNVEDEIVDLLGEKKIALEGLTKGTEEYTKKLKELIKAEEEENEISLSLAQEAAKEELEDAYQVVDLYTGVFGKKQGGYLEKMGIDYDVTRSGVGRFVTLAGLSTEESVEAQRKNFKLVKSAREKAFKAYQDVAAKGETDTDYGKYVVKILEELDEAYQQYEQYISDYDTATQKLKDFQNALSGKDGTETSNNLLNSINSIKDAIDSETEAAEAKAEADEKDLEIAEKRLAVEKALQELAEAKEKKVQVFRMGQGMVYADDIDAIQTAQEALTKAQADLTEAEASETTDPVSALYDEVDVLYNRLATEYGADVLAEGTKEAVETISSDATTEEKLNALKTILENFEEENSDYNKALRSAEVTRQQYAAAEEANKNIDWSFLDEDDGKGGSGIKITAGLSLQDILQQNALANMDSLEERLAKAGELAEKNRFIIGTVQVDADNAEEFADSLVGATNGATVKE